MSVIALDGLTKRFGDIVAVDGLTVQLGHGRVIGLLGPNGAGKTTTLRLLLGLVAPTSGSATIDGRPYRALDDPIRQVGAVLEATSFHPGRRARDHLRVLATTAGIAEHRVDEVLAGVGLAGAARRRVGGFSLGMRQRLGLAAALLGDPDVLVLDEPTNGLDPEGIRWLRDFLRAYAASGRTVLVSSHLLAEVAQTVDEVVVLTGGRLVAHAPLSELLRGRTVVRVRTPDAAALRAALDARGIHAELSTADLVLAHGATSEAVGRAIAATGLVAYEISQQHSDLEQAFLDLTTTTTTGVPRWTTSSDPSYSSSAPSASRWSPPPPPPSPAR